MYQKIVLASVSVFLILFLVKIVFSLPFQDETLFFAFVSFHVGYKALIECRKQQQVIWYKRPVLTCFIGLLCGSICLLAVSLLAVFLHTSVGFILEIVAMIVCGLLFLVFEALSMVYHYKQKQQTQQSSN